MDINSLPLDTLNEYLEYLDDLRESGITNMFGAGQYLMEDFDMSREDARTVLAYWMDTFSDRMDKLEISANGN